MKQTKPKKMLKRSAMMAVLLMGLVLTGTSLTTAQDQYDFEKALLVMKIDQPQKNDTPGNVTYSKKIALHEGVELTITVYHNLNSKFSTIEFETSGKPTMKAQHRGPLWPYSDVWNYRKKAQVIYALGNTFEKALKDLEVRFNGSNGFVEFVSTGNPANGTLVIGMGNNKP